MSKIKKSNIDYSLYLVTDRNIINKNRKDFIQSVKEAILGGVTVVQLREKNISSKEFYEIAKKVKKLTDEYNVALIINDRLDIALSVDADGVHLGQEDLPIDVAKKLLGKDTIIGISTATLEESIEAEKKGADYIGVGAMFSTNTKEDIRKVDIKTLKDIKENISIPVVAIGGINHSNVERLKPSKIDGIAVVSAILSSDDIKKSSKELKNIFS